MYAAKLSKRKEYFARNQDNVPKGVICLTAETHSITFVIMTVSSSKLALLRITNDKSMQTYVNQELLQAVVLAKKANKTKQIRQDTLGYNKLTIYDMVCHTII